MQEFRELFITMLKDFDHTKMSKNFLRDLIEANHIFILMLEMHKKNGTLSVASKKKKRKSKKESKEEKEKRLQLEEEHQRRLDEQDPGFKSRIWDKHFARVASLIQGQTELNIENDDLMPFDFVATSDEEFDAHKDTVVEKIQNLLVKNKPDDSISLFREARYLFLNDKDSFGTAEMSADEEFETFKNLFMKQLEIKREEKNDEPAKDEGLGDDEEMNCEEKDDFYDEEFGEQEETATTYVVEEENLDFENFLFRYTHPHILKSYILMLGEYGKNSDFLNRCCMSLLERIAYECQAPQCLYQLSLFNLINKIYKDPMSRCCMNIIEKSTQKKSIDDLYASSYSTEDMFAFFRQILSKFFEQTSKNSLMFLEILFFKDKKILHELGEEYSGYKSLNAENVSSGKSRKIAWTQDEQDELKELFEKYKRRFETNDEENYEDDIEDALNIKNQDAGDIIDLIMLNIKDGNRKRKDICTQLANLGCVQSHEVFKTNRYTFPNRKRMGRNRLWRDEDVDELRHSFFLISDEANELNKPLNEMMGKLQACLKINRTKSCIIDKLLSLGLIKSKSEAIGSKKQKKSSNDNDDDDARFINDTESDNDRKKEKKKKKKEKKSKKTTDNDLFDAESKSSSDESASSESESEKSEIETENNTEKNSEKNTEKNTKKIVPDKSDDESSPIKLKGTSTRDKILEALNLNDDSNESNIVRNRKSKSILSDDDDGDDDLMSKNDDNKIIEELLGTKDKVKSKRSEKKKAKKLMSDDSDDNEINDSVKRKSVAKKRKKILDSDEDSKD
ncbi:timeless -like protein, partial [Brachionus plicatilis]